MRKIQSEQTQLGEIAIAVISIDIDNRDKMPQLLPGLQYIYTNEAVRK